MPAFTKTLAGRILIAVLGIVLITVGVGVGLIAHQTAQLTDEQTVQQARSIAVAVASIPDVAEAVTESSTAAAMPALAESMRRQFRADYVVIIDATGKRYSHPREDLIGQRVEEPVIALDGQVHTGVDDGNLGRSANVKAPIFDTTGRPVGEVSVGVLESTVSARYTAAVGPLLLYGALALALGVVASLLLARTLKRVTFGLEPAEIVALVQEREAMLHGIREGVVGIDEAGRINVINEEARRLLPIHDAQLGSRIEDTFPEGQLRDILTGAVTGQDRVALTDKHLLVLNRMPVEVAGRQAGWVVTIRDRTEMEALLRQLDSVTGLTTALRAQEHEFANRLHVLSVLLELGETEEAARYSRQLSTNTTLIAEQVRARIASSSVTALLLAKITLAAERDVEVVLAPSSHLEHPKVDDTPLLTVMSNLIDNAIDAICDDDSTLGRQPRGVVTVTLTEDAGDLRLTVEDTGPGIPSHLTEKVFVDGYSTKPPRGLMHRGIGLALVHRLITRAGGRIAVHGEAGATFDVRLPIPVGQAVR